MNVHDFSVKGPGGSLKKLSEFSDGPILIVNTASKCGFTPQYKGLEELYRKYKEQGLTILGFPCNQFGSQEPGDEEEIKNFCSLTYDVTFPLMAKVEVNGDNAEPLYEFLKKEKPGLLGSKGIKWNFTKFLIDKSGKVVSRHGPTETPQALEGAVKKLL